MYKYFRVVRCKIIWGKWRWEGKEKDEAIELISGTLTKW